MEIKQYQAAMEAVLFASGEPVASGRLAEVLELDAEPAVRLAEDLMQDINTRGGGLRMLRLDDRYQLCTNADYAGYVRKALEIRRNTPLSQAAMEVLSIVAYKQPVTKLEIEKIRGVKSDHAVNRLVEYNLVYEVGRMDAPGRPALFATTEEFLRRFGVGGLSDLPHMNPEQEEEIKAEVEEELQMKLSELPESEQSWEEKMGREESAAEKDSSEKL